ncbi:MAG: hypothetical protein PHQ75_15100, partial [Thermoguttaceae bacterium]|nr:hypothetical protein [Thermoguttaceae bacterium]
MMKHCDSNSSHSTIDTSGSARDLFPRKKEQTFSKVSVILAFFLPGLGQLIQKRWRTSIFIFS